MSDPPEANEGSSPYVTPPTVETPAPRATTLRSELTGWSRYILGPRIGAGGMGEVYKAWDPRLRRWIALKFLFGRDEDSIRRFLREAEAQARLKHPAILEIYETGVVQERHFIAMQFVKGTSLMGVRDSTNVEAKIRLMRQIAEGLHAAHHQGLVHRDVKPGNVLVEEDETTLRPYLMDFGLAAYVEAPGVTATGMVIGTPWYMAPEQLGGAARVLDRRSDIYSLGATFYELLTGEVPFPGQNAVDVLMALLNRQPRNPRSLDPELPEDLDAVVMRCLAKEPRDRYQSASELADELGRILAGEPVEARPLGLGPRVLRRVRRHPVVTATILLTLLLILGLATWAIRAEWRAVRQAELGQRLGREVRDIEWLSRAAAMSPLHPTTTTAARIRDRMTRLEALTSSKDTSFFEDVGLGPVHYALGRGYLALGDPEQARQHLETARGYGEEGAGIDTALGLAYGRLYRRELAAVRRLDAARRDAARARIERDLRDPALAALRRALDTADDGGQGTGDITPDNYTRALVAFFEGNEDEAVTLASVAVGENPWLFEARLLIGEIFYGRALHLWEEGDGAASQRAMEEADRAFADAARIADSSAEAYKGRCENAGLGLHVAMHAAVEDTEEVTKLWERARDACPKAAVAQPQDADALRLHADALRLWGAVQSQRGEDPRQALGQAATIAERALNLSDGSVHFHLSLADLYLEQADWERVQGLDPRPTCAIAEDHYRRAVDVDPHDGTAQNNLGMLYRVRARWEAENGVDQVPALRLAYESFYDAAERGAGSFYAISNLGRSTLALADALPEREARTLLGETLGFLLTLPDEKRNKAWPGAVEAIEERLR